MLRHSDRFNRRIRGRAGDDEMTAVAAGCAGAEHCYGVAVQIDQLDGELPLTRGWQRHFDISRAQVEHAMRVHGVVIRRGYFLGLDVG